jgi:outer membrane beta-barrel protein
MTVSQAFRVLLLAALLTPASALAGDDGPYSAMAVQNRSHLVDHEFTLSVGVLPMDAFTKGLTVSGAYTLHFNENWAWEIAHFFWSFHLETDLDAELRAFNLKATPFEVLDFFATSNIVFKPIYWKGSALNSGIVYGEMLLLMGAGYARWTRSHRPMVDAGMALRFFAGDTFSFRLDTRYLLFISADGGSVDQDVWIGLGTSVGF